MLKRHGFLVFARIDFSGDVGRAVLTMRPEQIVIFGNPHTAGTTGSIPVPPTINQALTEPLTKKYGISTA